MSSVEQSSDEINHLSQSYIIEQLKRYGYKNLAATIGNRIQPPSDISHKIVKKISNQLAEEKKEQLEDICFELQLTADTLNDTFDTISLELFRDGIKWGRVVTFIAFTGALAVYCAEHSLVDQVANIMSWTESFIHQHLLNWITSSGGWSAFLKHFSDQEVNLNALVPAFIIGMGATALAVAGGLFMFKRKHLLS